MGIFEKIFGKREPEAAAKAKATFQLLEGYTPMFTTWAGSGRHGTRTDGTRRS